LSGRVFSNKYSSDSASNIIINELAAKRLGLTDPVGESVIMEDNNGHVYNKTIIGVVKDFHMRSLYDDIEPMAMIYSLNDIRKAVMRVVPNKIDKALKEIKAVFARLFPEEPFEYTFVEEGLKAKYISETRLQYVVIFFSILAICISISGLLGLAIFTTRKRTQEIGLRKVNGAVTIQIITMLNAGYFKWIAIAFIIACPIAYYTMNKWLQGFAFKTEMSWWLFLAAGAIASIIALMTVTSLSWKTATRNPAESLRFE
jgi:putative ABC transport system permease protein